MRRVALALLVLYTLLASTMGADAADGGGTFGLPFREDRAAYTKPSAEAPNGVFAGATYDDAGCTVREDGTKDCLPAGATMVQLANRDVLYWNAIEGEENADVGLVPQIGSVARNDQSRILRIRSAPRWLVPRPGDGGGSNPDGEAPLIPGTKTESGLANDASLFCSDQKLLADGRVIAAGGTDYYNDPGLAAGYGVGELEGVRSTRIYDPRTNAWTQAAPMHYGRWYPSLVTLPDGRLFAASGVTKLIKPVYPDHPGDSGTNVTQTEIYDPKADRWTDNSASNPDSSRSLPLYPRLHLLPTGNVYYDAAGQAYNPSGQSYDEAFWNIAAVYDVKANAWRDLGVPGLGSPYGGFRGSTFSAVLPMKAPYDRASFLTAGGVLLPTPGSYVPVANTRITTVSGKAGEESVELTAAGDLGRARWYSTAVPLPDGTVLAVSGADTDEVVTPGFESPIRTAEIFTPTYDEEGNVTGGSWADAGVAWRARTYHNNAILMPDGRVLVGGHAPIARGYGANGNNPHLPVREASNNFKDASFEIYSPPYLSRGPRPQIGNVPSRLSRGATLKIPVKGAKAADIASVVLMRNTAQTHLVDGDARTVELVVTKRSGSNLWVKVPSSASVLPAGPHLLFVNRKTSKGPVPSVGAQLFVR